MFVQSIKNSSKYTFAKTVVFCKVNHFSTLSNSLQVSASYCVNTYELSLNIIADNLLEDCTKYSVLHVVTSSPLEVFHFWIQFSFSLSLGHSASGCVDGSGYKLIFGRGTKLTTGSSKIISNINIDLYKLKINIAIQKYGKE